ncbi:hypothetical protein BJV82DRAFT_616988 [Fennellomyces sp. T-0311]|nr:hypothetical protein BJV82DRAFT_616988 [Fennellomyces sp. T-0311]
MNRQIQHLQQQKQTIDQQLDRYEHDLPLIQQYAHHRQVKRSKRQKQYNSFYWIPLLSARFKLKYMRARDKFAKAEHHVAQIRQAMETCQRSNRRISQSICHSREQHDQTKNHRNRIEKQLKHLEGTMTMLNEGRQFWYDFEKYQARTLMEAIHCLIQEHDEQWITAFKMACFEYDECIQHGEERWFTIQVEFDCALCNNVRWEWPCLDVHGLLCHACQRSIIEAQSKRLSVVSTAPSKRKRISLVSERSMKSSSSGGRLFVKRILKSMFGKCSYSSLVQ